MPLPVIPNETGPEGLRELSGGSVDPAEDLKIGARQVLEEAKEKTLNTLGIAKDNYINPKLLREIYRQPVWILPLFIEGSTRQEEEAKNEE
jgi:hypothetical protein